MFRAKEQLNFQALWGSSVNCVTACSLKLKFGSGNKSANICLHHKYLKILPSFYYFFLYAWKKKKEINSFLTICNFFWMCVSPYCESSLSPCQVLFWCWELVYCSGPFRRLIFFSWKKMRGAVILQRGWDSRVLRAGRGMFGRALKVAVLWCYLIAATAQGTTVIRVCCAALATHRTHTQTWAETEPRSHIAAR